MEHDSNQSSTDTSTNAVVGGWAIAALVFAIICITFNTSAMVLGAGFFVKFLAVVAGSVLGLIGALLGDAIRKFAHPDAVYTSAGMLSLMWIKLFWMLGPQVIGLIAGGAIGCGLVLR
jgi:hypothetical protein